MAMIALMMEAVRTSETSVYLYETTQVNIPGGCHLHTRRCSKDLKFHLVKLSGEASLAVFWNWEVLLIKKDKRLLFPVIPRLLIEEVSTSETSVYF
jgi:hypothetical protein